MCAQKLVHLIKKCLRRNSLDRAATIDNTDAPPSMTQSHRKDASTAHARGRGQTAERFNRAERHRLPPEEAATANCAICSRLSPNARAPASAVNNKNIKITCCPYCGQPLYSALCGDPNTHVSHDARVTSVNDFGSVVPSPVLVLAPL